MIDEIGCVKPIKENCKRCEVTYCKLSPVVIAAQGIPSAGSDGSTANKRLSSEQFADAVNWFANPNRPPAALTFPPGVMQDMAAAYEAATCEE